MRFPFQVRRPGSVETREKARAFSLIELLVVIAVIAVLAALILTGTVVAKKKAQQAQCAHNVCQLGLAVQVFVSDNHVYPLAANPSIFKDGYSEQDGAWVTALEGILDRGEPVHPGSINFMDKGILLYKYINRWSRTLRCEAGRWRTIRTDGVFVTWRNCA